MKFYVTWYPTVWMPASTNFNVKKLNSTNRAHLKYVQEHVKNCPEFSIPWVGIKPN
jgi:hypothetical protein